MPIGCAKFHVIRCNESCLRGDNADFWPVSKSFRHSAGVLALEG